MLHNVRRIVAIGVVCFVVLSVPAYSDIPSGGPLRLTAPAKMVKDKTLTLKAEFLDQYGCKAAIDWRKWSVVGAVSARRVSDGRDVPLSITIFETYYKGAGGGTPPEDSIRFYNGVGSVSITLDNPDAVAGEDIEVVVTADGKTASKVVAVLDNVPGTFRELSGTLSGDDLTWGPGDGVIHLTGHVTVPSGSTLTINAGTLVMADKGTAQQGVRIDVNGSLNAEGTADAPVFFFATEGPPAMELISENENSWGGIYHDGPGTSTYSYAIITGGGNGYGGQWHLYPPMLRFYNDHSLLMSHCILADAPAKLILGDYGSGSFTISHSLLTRGGFAATFGAFDEARAHMPVLFEDTWITRVGRGDESQDLDGDALHWNSDSADGLTFRRCIITDVGDDCIDGSDSFYIKSYVYDSIVYDLDDKFTTYWPGDIYANNLLLFACNKGFESVNGYPTQSTLADIRPFPEDYGGDWWVERCIASPGGTQTGYTCSRFSADYTVLANADHQSCGTGNVVGDPLFVDPMTGSFPPATGDYRSSYDYNLQVGSPALTAGPFGERVGWLGFPAAEPCTSAADCGSGGTYDDDNPCTADTCEVGVCVHSLIDQCIACCDAGDCDYGDPCVIGTCEADGICSFVNNEGGECDDGLFCTETDTCQGGVCIGSGNPCAPLTCDEVADQCTGCENDQQCADGVFCNGVETCDAGSCVPGSDPCDDGVGCTQDSCDEESDACTNIADDLACDDSNVCTADTCDSSLDCQYVDLTGACDDGLFCTLVDACVDGTCVGTGDACDDGLECTEDSCDESADECTYVLQDGWCLIDGVCFADGAVNPANGCEYCSAVAGEGTAAGVTLQAVADPVGSPRGLDVANQMYVDGYEDTYDYSSASVSVDFFTGAQTLHGTLVASGLKPNFAYQFKLYGIPETDSNEQIGLTGRWNEEEWDGSVWVDNGNLNSKGDGSSPNPNDVVYFARRDVLDDIGGSPTGKKYRYTGYLVFDYFITNEAGNATLVFAQDSSYHVLFKTSQRTRTADDGPIKSYTFVGGNPDPVSAYDTVYSETTEEVFGEWERLPAGGMQLPSAHYEGKFWLTEESFHGSGVAGSWGAAMEGAVSFDLGSTSATSWSPRPSGTPCPDGQFCNGEEACEDGTCIAGVDPCPGLVCDELNDVCVSGECVEDADCADGVFCNGEELCVDQSCVSGAAPCSGVCEACDESTDSCMWCIFDLDGDEFIGPGDFSFFAGCYGGSYACDPPNYRSGADPCCITNFDESADSFVGPGDFSGLAGCYGGGCGECANCWGQGR